MEMNNNDDNYNDDDAQKRMSRIRIAVQEIIEIEVESEELSFSDLKKEALDIFKFAKENTFNTKSNDIDVT